MTALESPFVVPAVVQDPFANLEVREAPLKALTPVSPAVLALVGGIIDSGKPRLILIDKYTEDQISSLRAALRLAGKHYGSTAVVIKNTVDTGSRTALHVSVNVKPE